MLQELGFVLIMLGLAALVVGLLLAQGGRVDEPQGKGAAVIFVGPLPIAIGNDSRAVIIAALLAVGMLVALALMLYLPR
jgi:uncharacterized membrane protein